MPKSAAISTSRGSTSASVLIGKSANQRLRRAIMGENGGGASRFVRVYPRAIVLRLTILRWLATPKISPARAA